MCIAGKQDNGVELWKEGMDTLIGVWVSLSVYNTGMGIMCVTISAGMIAGIWVEGRTNPCHHNVNLWS